MTRPEALAENVYRPDHGCQWSPRCLTCPYSICREDVSMPDRSRSARVAKALLDGERPERVSAATGISLRTAYRVQAVLKSYNVRRVTQ